MKQAAKAPRPARHSNDRLRDKPKSPPLIGYMRVSKADGSQVLDLQRDALIAAGVTERHLYRPQCIIGTQISDILDKT